MLVSCPLRCAEHTFEKTSSSEPPSKACTQPQQSMFSRAGQYGQVHAGSLYNPVTNKAPGCAVPETDMYTQHFKVVKVVIKVVSIKSKRLPRHALADNPEANNKKSRNCATPRKVWLAQMSGQQRLALHWSSGGQTHCASNNCKSNPAKGSGSGDTHSLCRPLMIRVFRGISAPSVLPGTRKWPASVPGTCW